VPPRKTLYPLTPRLSVLAVQERLTNDEDAATAVSFVGTDGAALSTALTVTVLLAVTEPCEFWAVSVKVVV